MQRRRREHSRDRRCENDQLLEKLVACADPHAGGPREGAGGIAGNVLGEGPRAGRGPGRSLRGGFAPPTATASVPTRGSL